MKNIVRTKHVAFLACLLLLPWLSACTESEAWMSPVMISGGTPSGATEFCDTQSGYLLCEDFEGSTSCESGSADENCRNTWLASAACATAVDYGYTTAPLEGTYSAYMEESSNAGSCNKKFTLSSIDTIYSVARVKYNTISGVDAETEETMAIYFGSYCQARIGWDGSAVRFGVYQGSTTWGSTVTVTAAQEYYLWLEEIKNTSCSLYVSTTATKPGTPEATMAGSAFNIVEFAWNVYDFGYDIDQLVIDNILVDDAVIGSQ